MKKIQFGKTGMEITKIGLGAWAIGGSWQWGWGAQDDEDSLSTIRYALDNGINWIDTAAVYGLGHSEEIVGKAVAGRRDKVYIFTKCSLRWKENNPSREAYNMLKKESIREEIEQSLKRLKTDYIDLYQIHWPNPDEDIEEGWEEMMKLKFEGTVRHIGVSNHSVSQMERLMKIAPVETLQPPYHLLNRDIEKEILPYCIRKKMGVIVYSPMASGLLTGKMTRERIASLPDDDWRKRDAKFTEPALTKNLELVERLKKIAEEKNCSPGEVAIAWALHNKSVSAAIVGMRKKNQVDDLLKAGEIVLTEKDLKFIEG